MRRLEGSEVDLEDLRLLFFFFEEDEEDAKEASDSASLAEAAASSVVELRCFDLREDLSFSDDLCLDLCFDFGCDDVDAMDSSPELSAPVEYRFRFEAECESDMVSVAR